MGGVVPTYNIEELSFIDPPSEKNFEEYREKSILGSFQKSADELFRTHPPNVAVSNKKILDKLSSKKEIPFEGIVKFSRFCEMDFPKCFPSNGKTKFLMREDVFTYDKYKDESSEKENVFQMDYHVNFADKHLFGYYSGGLFAQDEMQTAEMPILASVREYLISLPQEQERNNGPAAGGPTEEVNPQLVPLTRDNEYASPCIIRNAQRRVMVKVDKNRKEGRPNGLYGNLFCDGSSQAVVNATVVFPHPQLENIIAMEAPKSGNGCYDFNTILFIFRTAFSGFLGAKMETWNEWNDQKNKTQQQKVRTVINTGNWGTGVYGGHKVLMALLQISAAYLAGIDVLIYHTFLPKYTEAYQMAEKMFTKYLKENSKKENTTSVMKFLKFVQDQNFEWGVGDGN